LHDRVSISRIRVHRSVRAAGQARSDLQRARDALAFARRLVNSGRLSVPAVLSGSALNTPDVDMDFPVGPGAMVPGAPTADAPVHGSRGDWLLDHLGGEFTLLAFGNAVPPRDVAALAEAAIPCRVVQVGGGATPGATRVEDAEGLVARRYDGRAGTLILLRPDQHVAARWRAFDAARIRAAIARATCND